jgi:hypothetical protein
MKYFEKGGLAVAFTIFVMALSNYYYRTTAIKHLDSVFLFESSLSILTSGRPVSETVTTWADALKTFMTPVGTLCQAELKRQATQNYNVLANHAYFALYPLSLLTAVTGPELAFAILNALAHTALLFIPFIFLRMYGVGVFASLAFMLAVTLYPAWSFSAIGDYYLDRLYMPFALLSLYFAHKIITRQDQAEPGNHLILGHVAATVLAALCTERAAIIMIGEVVFFLLLFPQVRKTVTLRNAMLITIGGISFCLFLYYIFIFQGLEGSGQLVKNALPILRDPLRRLQAPGLVAFVLVNLLTIGFLALFSGTRYLVLLLGAMLPNLLISTGGGELNGWATHYHAMYVPFLIFAASLGYVKLANYFQTGIGHFAQPVIFAAYLLLVAGWLNPYTGKLEDQFSATASQAIIRSLYLYYVDPQNSPQRAVAEATKSLEPLIPSGSKVSAVEAVMPALYRGRHISYYPIEMDNADYLVIGGTAAEGKPTSVSGAISYLGPPQAEALNQCLSQRMSAKGFSLHKAIPAIGVLVFKRTQNTNGLPPQ